MLVSVIICSLNGERVLPVCLESVLGSEYSPFEVIVVDNGSSDGTSKLVTENFPQVKLLRAGRNLGFAGGNNLGLKAAQGEILVLLNDDTAVSPDWLTAAVKAAEQLPDWGIFGARLLYPDQQTIQHAGGIVGANALTQHIGNGEIDRGQYNKIRECDYVTGAAFFIRRELMQKIGLLDEGYFPIYFEEVDYCWRARRLGYKVYYIPHIKVYHYESRTTRKFSPGFLYKYHRNRIRFILKNFGINELWRALKCELKWLWQNRPADLLLPLLKAYLVNIYLLPETLRIRMKEKQKRKSTSA